MVYITMLFETNMNISKCKSLETKWAIMEDIVTVEGMHLAIRFDSDAWATSWVTESENEKNRWSCYAKHCTQ